MTANRSEQNWITFGKVAAVVGLFGTLVGIWVALKPDAVNLKARATTATIAVPPDYLSAISTFQKLHSREFLKQIFNSNPPTTMKSEDTISLLYKIEDTIHKSTPNTFKYSPPSYTGYCVLEIENDGSVPADDVALSTPFSALTQIRFPNSEEKLLNTNNSLQLGTVRPGEKVLVQFWLSTPISFYNQSSIVLSHKTGRGTISFSSTVFGFTAWLSNNSFFIFLLPAFLYFAWAITQIALQNRARNRRLIMPKVTADSSTEPSDTPEA